jgi:hypothetical protein
VSSCLVVHRETSTPKLEQTNLPLFLVGKVCEEISSAFISITWCTGSTKCTKVMPL